MAGAARHTQRARAAPIRAAGGDDRWTAKENQPPLQADIEAVFTSDGRTVAGHTNRAAARRLCDADLATACR